MKNDLKGLVREINRNIIKLHSYCRDEVDNNQEDQQDSIFNLENESRQIDLIRSINDNLQEAAAAATASSEDDFGDSNQILTSNEFSERGILYVTSVDTESVASRAGFLSGDYIISFALFDHTNFTSIDQIKSYLNTTIEVIFFEFLVFC